MSRHELQLLKEVSKRTARECNTPEKAIEQLKKIGYLNEHGEVAERTL